MLTIALLTYAYYGRKADHFESISGWFLLLSMWADVLIFKHAFS